MTPKGGGGGGGGGYQPIYLGSFDFELAVELSGPPSGSTFLGVFKVPDPQALAWRYAQIWALKIAIS